MKRGIGGLKSGKFDILVIGGGINGCAIARDAALRGAKAALIEKKDFAAAASGKTTKLIHGGIRYLEQFNFKLVYEALHERQVLLSTAPQLVRPLEFIIPVYKNDPRSLLKIKTGVTIYDLMAGKNNLRCHRSLKKNELISLERNIDPVNLKGGVIYCDAQMDDVRLCLDNAISAYNSGCCIANKVEVTGFIKEKERIVGVQAQDLLTKESFSISASIVVNATGAWSNSTIRMDEPKARSITRPTKGVHIIYRKLPHERAILLSNHKDKRIFFVIPWRNFTLIGTTDTDFNGSLDEVYASADEVEYLLDETRRIFPGEKIDKNGIITTYASLRPLVNTEGRPAWQVTREHLIRESASGLISVVGGKYTTYRHLAEQVVDIALRKFSGRIFKECITASTGPSLAQQKREDLRDSVEYFVKEEMANTLIDLLVRRLQLSTTTSLGLDCLQECADIMGGILGWTDAQKESQVSAYKDDVRKNTLTT